MVSSPKIIWNAIIIFFCTTVNFGYKRSAGTSPINPLYPNIRYNRRKVRSDTLRTQVLNAQNTIFEAFHTFPFPKSPQRKRALRNAREIQIGTRAFGYFDASSEQKTDPL